MILKKDVCCYIYNIAKEQLVNLLNKFSKNSLKGINLNTKDVYRCCSSICEEPKFLLNDCVVIFKDCAHYYHKECLYNLYYNKNIKEDNNFNSMILDDVYEYNKLFNKIDLLDNNTLSINVRNNITDDSKNHSEKSILVDLESKSIECFYCRYNNNSNNADLFINNQSIVKYEDNEDLNY